MMTAPSSLVRALILSAIVFVSVSLDAQEVEPNGTSATATPLVLTGGAVRVRASVFPVNDIDVFSFEAVAGDRVYAALQTSFDASASGDSVLTLLDTDGTTTLEEDNNDGTFNANSSSLAGTIIPATGTYYLQVRHNVATGTIRPYDLYLQVRSGVPVAETEPNNTSPGEALAGSGWMSGTVTGIDPAETDFFSLTLAAGDTVFLSVDADPERDSTTFDPRVGLDNFAGVQDLLANDSNATSPNSEAFFLTVKDAGVYTVFVDSTVAAGLGVTATYHLNVSVFAAPATTGITYTSTDVPRTIPVGPDKISSTLTIPDEIRIKKLRVHLNLTHAFMQDMDVHLVSPSGDEIGLFTDVGAGTVGGPITTMDIILDDEAALPFFSTTTQNLILQPELAYRLDWFRGVQAQGTWTLVVRDDAIGDGGTINSWALEIVEDEVPAAGATIYSTDFESGDAGFTHSGAEDEWERGLPTSNPINTANSGVNCWKTDLDGTYNASSSQDLFSPEIDLSMVAGTVSVIWAQKYHLESASFDHAFVEIQEVGGAGMTRKVWEWQGATMNNTVGNPTVTIAQSGGWGLFHADISDFLGKVIRIRFHLDTDTTVQLSGWAIDDVSVVSNVSSPTFTDDSITVLENAAPVDLATATGPSPSGGTFSGMGVDGMAGTFDPTGLPLGPYTVTYTANSASADLTVNVIEAPSLTVTSVSDAVDELDGQTTLREAMDYAATLVGLQTVTFSNTSVDGAVNFHDVTADTITLGGTELVIRTPMTIEGPGAMRLSISGNDASRILAVVDSGAVILRGMTLTEGSAIVTVNGPGGAIYCSEPSTNLTIEGCLITDCHSDQDAGAIAIYANATVTIRDSTVSNNSESATGGISGGGIVNFANLTVVNSTVSGNETSSATPSQAAGGIVSFGNLTILNSTITGNKASVAGSPGGIRFIGGSLTMHHSLVAGNLSGPASTPSDISGSPSPLVASYNLVGDAATSGGIIDGTDNNLVGDGGVGTLVTAEILDTTLALNGGATPTHRLVVGSPAIDAGDPAFDGSVLTPALTNDQRGPGFTRVVKGIRTRLAALLDLGAYELFAAPLFTTDRLSVVTGGGPIDLASASGVSPAGGSFAGPGVSGGLFDPTGLVPGDYRLTYTIGDGLGGSNAAELLVTVSGIPEDRTTPARLTVQKPKRFSPTEIDTRSRTQRLEVTNRGSETATGLRLLVKGAGKKDFKVIRPALRILGPGATTSFKATFHPRVIGNRKATVTVQSSAAPVTVRLSGQGKTNLNSTRDPDRLDP